MATTGLDFAKLSLKDALDLAILIEEEAGERYEELAAQLETHRTPEAARFFRFMAGNEQKHLAELEQRRHRLFAGAPREVSRAQLFDVEAPEYDAARAFMTPRQALEAALASEVKAHGFFTTALPGLRDPEVKALFEELCDEELEHQRLVQREIANLPPEGGIERDDVADEPVGL